MNGGSAMGLFGKREPCAICAGKVKGLLPWRIEGQLVCDDCYGSVDLPGNVTGDMTMDEFRDYLKFRAENKLLKEKFVVSEQVDFGWLNTKFMFDFENRFLCMDKNLDKTIFEGSNIKSFIIMEDTIPLYEGSAAGLRCYVSSVPDRAMTLAPQINMYNMQMRLYQDVQNRNDGNANNAVKPHLNVVLPFEKFNIEIYFDHPYWHVFNADMGGPFFNSTNPDLNDYVRSYHDKALVMEKLATALMRIAFPGRPEQVVDATGYGMQTPFGERGHLAMSVDSAEEIKRFKSLMDQGVITEEEFAAKKKQLLGI